MTKHVGLIGYPLRHSISPAFQQAAFDHLGLDVRYELWEIEPRQIQSVVKRIRHPMNLGINITVPYKETILPFLDELDGLAQRIGAVNTVVNQKGKLIGSNTDAGAFLRALHDEGGFEPRGKRVVLLGAGGVARAASFALLGRRVGALTLVNRTPERAQKLIADLNRAGHEVRLLSWEDARLGEALAECDLLVNCTPLGMKHSAAEEASPLEAKLIPKQALIYDLVYNPVETPFLKKAKQAGARTLGGLSMLVYQGAGAFELWTGREAPVDIMAKAAREAL